MPRVKVKICGITNWPDARCAVEAGADFLGFNFYRPSPRYISPAKARAIIHRLPRGIAAVGVFVNEPDESMRKIARTAGLDFLQLHGDEPPELVAQLRATLPVIKAVRVRNGFRTAQLVRFRRASAFLLDGFDPRRHGGTGKTFNWEVARRAGSRRRIFLAGGLTAENVADAIRVARPYAVDVCSGVESRPGRKDPARISALMNAVKSTRRRTR